MDIELIFLEDWLFRSVLCPGEFWLANYLNLRNSEKTMSNAIQIIPVSVSDEACTKGEYFNIAYNLLKAQQSELTVIMEKVNSQSLLKKI